MRVRSLSVDGHGRHGFLGCQCGAALPAIRKIFGIRMPTTDQDFLVWHHRHKVDILSGRVKGGSGMTCGVCGQPISYPFPRQPTFRIVMDGSVVRLMLDRPFRVDLETGAMCWCPEGGDS